MMAVQSWHFWKPAFYSAFITLVFFFLRVFEDCLPLPNLFFTIQTNPSTPRGKTLLHYV